jgi:hypothetical protein
VLKRAAVVHVWLAISATARAQDLPKLGITLGYPSAVGLLWNAADRLALRPEFTWSKTSTDAPAIADPILGPISNGTSSDTWQTGAGVSALLYIGKYESLRTYVSPRLAYSQTNASSGVLSSLVSSSNTTSTWSTSGSFGAQYTAGRHFGIFGEVGLNYASTTSRTTLVESRTTVVGVGAGGLVTTSSSAFTVRSDSHSHSTGTRSGAGVIFFF